MDLPRDSSDIQIALACQACNGNGGFGIRNEGRTAASQGKSPHQPCTSCSGSGWTLKRPADLTPAELARLLQRLPQVAGTSCPSILGTIIEAGDDDEGQPRILIHTTREELQSIELIAFYQQSRIAFEPITQQPA
jgi:hypothetical protein